MKRLTMLVTSDGRWVLEDSAEFLAALGEGVSIVDPGAACAASVAQMIVGFAPSPGTMSFEVSGDQDEFAAHAISLSGIRIDSLRHVTVRRDGKV